jgi:hypothetical protein
MARTSGHEMVNLLGDPRQLLKNFSSLNVRIIPRLSDQPWRIMSIGLRQLAHGCGSESLGINSLGQANRIAPESLDVHETVGDSDFRASRHGHFFGSDSTTEYAQKDLKACNTVALSVDNIAPLIYEFGTYYIQPAQY